MTRKTRYGWSAITLIGWIYAVLGGVFLTLGIILALTNPMANSLLFLLIFGGIGGLFLILGIIFLLYTLGRQRRAQRLIAAGRYVWGEVAEVRPDYNVRINGRHPYVISVKYSDPQGRVHIFKSPGIRAFCDSSLLGKPVRIYIDSDAYRHYYVDVDPILPNVIEHD